MSSRPADSRTTDAGIVMRATAIVRTNSSGSNGSAPASGVPSTLTRRLIGTDLRMRRQARQRRDHADAVGPRLAHADDAAAAHRDAGGAHVLEGIEAVLVDARRDDLAIELGRGVEIVVVVIEAGRLEPAAPGRA